MAVISKAARLSTLTHCQEAIKKEEALLLRLSDQATRCRQEPKIGSKLLRAANLLQQAMAEIGAAKTEVSYLKEN